MQPLSTWVVVLAAGLIAPLSVADNVFAQQPQASESILIAPSIGYIGPFSGSEGSYSLVANRQSNDFPEDPWLSQDKFLHAAISFLLTLSAQYAYEAKLNMARKSALPVSMFSASLVGIGKEVYDLKWGPRNYFSAKDIAANSFGILIAATFIAW